MKGGLKRGFPFRLTVAHVRCINNIDFQIPISFPMSKRSRIPLVSDVWKFAVTPFCDWSSLAALAQTSRWWRDVATPIIRRRVAPAVAVMKEVKSLLTHPGHALQLEAITHMAAVIWLGGSSMWLEFGGFREGRSCSVLVLAASAFRANAPLDVTIGVNGPAEMERQSRGLQTMCHQRSMHSASVMDDRSIKPTDCVQAGSLRARFVSLVDTDVVLDNGVFLLSGPLVDDHLQLAAHHGIARLLVQMNKRKGHSLGLCTAFAIFQGVRITGMVHALPCHASDSVEVLKWYMNH